MVDFVWPSTLVRPSRVDLVLRSSTGIFESPLNGAIQTVARAGANRWALTFQFMNLTPAKFAEVLAILAQLRGAENRLITRTFDEPNLGVRNGTPVVNIGGQTGNVLNVKNAPLSVTGWLRRGDYFSVGYELKIVTADVATTGGGFASIPFEPRLRASPADGASLELVNPRGRFIMAGNQVQWSSRPGRWRDVAVELAEAIV